MTTPFGTGGSGGYVDATGAAARFRQPRGIAADGAGNLWVADTDNQRVRKIVIATGVVTTVAGNGVFGTADGTGAGVGFSSPFGIAADASGNVWVFESFGHDLRKLTAGGVTTTVAGLAAIDGFADGAGAAALFRRPHAICADGATIYVTDKQNQAIRKIDPATGSVTTVAGAGSAGSADGVGPLAKFDGPFGCAADGAATSTSATATTAPSAPSPWRRAPCRPSQAARARPARSTPPARRPASTRRRRSRSRVACSTSPISTITPSARHAPRRRRDDAGRHRRHDRLDRRDRRGGASIIQTASRSTAATCTSPIKRTT